MAVRIPPKKFGLVLKLALIVGFPLLLCMVLGAFLTIAHHNQNIRHLLTTEADRIAPLIYAKTDPNLATDANNDIDQLINEHTVSFIVRVSLLTLLLFVVIMLLILLVLQRLVSRPIHELIDNTKNIAKGGAPFTTEPHRRDEIGQLARALKRMGKEIEIKQTALNKQIEEYLDLFNNVPCIISIQDRTYKMIRYNRMCADNFDPIIGAYCYQVYKGRMEKCVQCPVEKMFQDGKSYFAEESVVDKKGHMAFWMVLASPVRNEKGEIVAAMEMSLDITHRKRLEKELEASKKKYRNIFNNIPNPTFVLDAATLLIINSNASVTTVYGYTREEILNKTFLLFFDPNEQEQYKVAMQTHSIIDKVKQRHKTGRTLYVNIQSSPSEQDDKKVLLVTTCDITARLEVEQQIIHTGKMATLGEMATGIAHELNQPLSVMKTVSSFFLEKLEDQEQIDATTLYTMLGKIDTNVDRASHIINHLRQFARKSDVTLERVQLNDIIEKSMAIFGRQFKLKEIEMIQERDPNLPLIKGDPGRLEQVFINLLVNARGAFEESPLRMYRPGEKRIDFVTFVKDNLVILRVTDTGPGIPSELTEKIFEPFFTTKEVGN